LKISLLFPLFLPASQMALKRPVDEGDDLRRYSYRERSSRVHPSRQKISVISGTCPPLAVQCLKILVNPVIPSKISSTNDQRLSTNDSLSAICAGIHDQNPKKIKFFYNFLTLYPTTTYPLFLYAARCPLYAVFRPNAQLRPIVERRCFFCPLILSSEFCVRSSMFFFMDFVLSLYGRSLTIECVYTVFVCASLGVQVLTCLLCMDFVLNFGFWSFEFV